jgi:aminoglycoside phosphotransferase (APT) family kinase protein
LAPASPSAAAALIRARFGLPVAVIVPFGEGFDNTAFLVDERWVFRFARRDLALPLLATERRFLPLIAAAVPVAVPVPCFASDECVGYALLPGTTADALDLDDDARKALAAPLGEFLRVLHALPVPSDLPRDTLGRLDAARLKETIRTRLGREVPGEFAAPSEIRVCHGDLYSRHLLVAHGRLSGVIDWGDMHAGDPAVDLAVAHIFLPPSAHGIFRAAYGEISDTRWQLARLRALHHLGAEREHANRTSDENLAREATRGLAWLSE